MASQKQIGANRRNAKKSTGPRSATGKARSRRNSLTHGLTARQTLLPNEDPAAFNALRQAMLTELAPEGALERQLVELAASLIWRLRRVSGLEVALFEWVKHVQAKKDDGLDCLLNLERRALLPDAFTGTDSDCRSTQEVLDVGRTFEAMLNSGLTGKLSRYESGFQRQLSSTLKDLRELKANRANLPKIIDAAE